MPQRLSKTAEPADINQAAFQMVRRKGGKVGCKRRMVTMTPEQRLEVDLKAAHTRVGQN